MKSKTIASLLTMTLLFAFVSASFPLTAIVQAQVPEITWLTHWESEKEQAYWADVINYYNTYVCTTSKIVFQYVSFDFLFDEITTRNIAGNDPDIIHMHAMWIPGLASWGTGITGKGILSIPPQYVQSNIKAYYSTPAVEGVSYKEIIWGYPTEFNTWALVYNKALIQNATQGLPPYTGLSAEDRAFLSSTLTTMEARNPYQPITWDDLKRAAKLLAVWDTSTTPPTIQKVGFIPLGVGWSEEERFQFMSLLWSNSGGYLDLSIPDVSFDDNASGYQVMQLYHDLGYVEPRAYDPATADTGVQDYEWTGWGEETIAMMILPTWMQYVREAMISMEEVSYFDHIGVTVIPTPTGEDQPVKRSLQYSWVLTVTQKCVERGNDGAAWNFLTWMNTPRPAGFLKQQPDGPMRWEFGAVPKGDGCSIAGDYLITDSIIPSRVSDQDTGRVTISGYETGETGYAGDLIKEDHWFKGFIDIANLYGRPDKPFIKSEEAQAEIGLMMDKVCYAGADPVEAVDTASASIQAILPISGDINIDDIVDIYDVPLMVNDIDACPHCPCPPATSPCDPQAPYGPVHADGWYRGRSDFSDDSIVDVLDITILSTNYGRSVGG